ncbi:uncharacterized protein LOC129756062 [Uranotaenia lowii]|uniref:uncharacterized protein LOC129756062 n=1 Tax=Uranotaenia lowii TaxID=190385 RepID=UPI002479DCDD|nr:uncharacterized protein LOC129756062 [Uranotaenia lowii]
MEIKIFVIFSLYLHLSGFAWDLSSIGLHNFTVKHVSLYKSRAFLTILCSCNVSLVEAAWPENKIGHRLKIISDGFIDEHNNCDKPWHVIGTDVDSVGRLWILDQGVDQNQCSAKLIIRSLMLIPNKEIRYDFSFNNNRIYRSIVVDPARSVDGDTRAFITLENTDYLLFFSLLKRSFGKLKLESKYAMGLNSFSLSEVTINQNQLYISDSLTSRLFSLPVKTLRHLSFPVDGINKIIIKTNVTYVGRLLGRAYGLRLDLKDQLFYILPRDGAIVKWRPGQALRAENHLVVFQRKIDVTQIILGTAGKAWAVSSMFVSENGNRHCIRIA